MPPNYICEDIINDGPGDVNSVGIKMASPQRFNFWKMMGGGAAEGDAMMNSCLQQPQHQETSRVSFASSSSGGGATMAGKSTCAAGANNMPRGSGMILALRDISNAIRSYVESGEWKVMARWFFWDLLVPLMIATLLIGILLYVGQKIYRYFVPYSAVELHKQGLQALEPTSRKFTPLYQSNSSNTATNSTLSPDKKKQITALEREKQQAEKQAESLWKKALQRDPEYGPAMVSLAAMYLYRQDQPSKALELIRSRSSRIQKQDSKRDLNNIQADARAMQQGNKLMVQSDLAETEYLTVLAALSRDNKYSKENQLQ